MSTSPQTAHRGCKHKTQTGGQASRHEPEFDAERVIWDADYRRDVMERLRQWRSRNANSSATEMKAA
jgi:hypothetical protein